MDRAFADYASDILNQLEPPLPPLEGDERMHVLDLWHDLFFADAIEVDSPVDLILPGPGIGEGASDSEKALVEGAISERGLDALAFYKSIRFRNQPPFVGRWGIFIFDFSIRFLSDEIEAFYPSKYTASERAQIAFNCLRDHEAFHFRVDVWALGVEGITRKSLYESYLNQVYVPMRDSLVVVEESLANAFALKRAERSGYSRWLRQFMRAQPAAYAAFDKAPQQLMRAQLAAQIIYGRQALAFIIKGPAWEQTPFIGAGRPALVGEIGCPTYRVPLLQPTQAIPAGLEIPTIREVRDGFLPKYLSGIPIGRTDHQFVKIDNGEQIKLPNDHRGDRLKVHEYKNILYKAGMRPIEYRKERERTHIWRQHCPRPEPKPPIGDFKPASDSSGSRA